MSRPSTGENSPIGSCCRGTWPYGLDYPDLVQTGSFASVGRVVRSWLSDRVARAYCASPGAMAGEAEQRPARPCKSMAREDTLDALDTNDADQRKRGHSFLPGNRIDWARMTMRLPAAYVSVAICLLQPIGMRPQSIAQTFQLSGRILIGHESGLSGSNTVYVALWQADGFLSRPAKQVRIEGGRERVFRFEAPAGYWAGEVASFVDRDIPNADIVLK